MDASRGGNAALAGGYGYRQFSDCGANHSRSGAMLNALGFATGGDRNDARVQSTVNYIATIFGNEAAPDCWGGRNLGNFYAMYQVSKGMRSFRPQFDLIGPNNLDWYAAYADWLIANQQADGRWQNDNTWMANREIVHSLGLLVLIPTLFEAPPTAVASASPRAVGPGDTVTFYHGGSYALDPQAPITTYRWNFVDYPAGLDLNGDGDFDDEGEHAPEDANGDGAVTGDEIVWDYVTNDPTDRPTWSFQPDIEFGEVAIIPVRLQVEDTEGRIDDDDESVRIEISFTNHAPVALAHPGGNDRSYTALIGNTVRLDASNSFDPDSDDEPAPGFPRDSLTFVGWDLDGDGTFETEMPVVDFVVPDDWEVDTTRVIQLRVCDDGTWVGVPDAECEGGDCSLCRTADARISVTVGPNLSLGGEDAFEVDEGKTLLIDASDSSHPAERGFDLIWYCDGLSLDVRADGLAATVDATRIDGLEDGPTFACSVTATDDVGVSAVLEFTVTVQNDPPEIFSARVRGEPVEGGSVDIVVLADDVPGDAPFLLYSVDCDGDGEFEVRNTRNNVVSCALDDGRYDPIVVVDDQDGGTDLAELPGFDVENLPPTFDDFECPATREGELVVMQIGVSDPADPVSCALGMPVPDQAQLAPRDCTLVWTPTYEQALAGQVDFSLLADDGDGGSAVLAFSCFPTIRDDDGDGLPDSWEERFGTDPTVDDCDVDYDGDGLSNCEEFEGDTFPRIYEGPTPPTLVRPIAGVIVNTATPALVSTNATDGLGRPLTYRYRVYEAADAVEALWMSGAIPQGPGQTQTPVAPNTLRENATYWWTVAANNGIIDGPSPARERFVVDAIEEPAPPPRILSPIDGGSDPDAIPPVVLTPVVDPDPSDTELTYECEAATDAAFQNRAGTAEGEAVGGQVTVAFAGLAGDTTYWIRCRAVDAGGNPGGWSAPVRYSINEPPIAAVDPPVLDVLEGGDGLVDGSVSSDPDGGELSYDWSCTGGLDIQPGDGTLTVSAEGIDAPAAGRTYQCRLTVTDAHGARDSTDFVVRVQNAPPTAEVVCPAVSEGTPATILIEGIDPGGDVIACGWADPAPEASRLAGCTVEWTPTYAQALAGEVAFRVRLTDDDGASSDVAFVCAPSVRDDDDNGLPDTWEEDNLVDDPDGDADGDGRTNREEFEDGTDPNHYDGPSDLSLVSPVGDAIVDTLTPWMVVNNGSDGLDRPLTYRYAIFDAADAEEALIVSDLVDEGDETTEWQIPADILAENGRFWWTAQADNGLTSGAWAEREVFRVDATPEAPSAPVIERPADGDEVPDSPVRVRLANSSDPDPEAELDYACEASPDETFEMAVATGEAPEGADGTTRVDLEGELAENQDYWIRCKAIDETGLESEWSEPVRVTINRSNEPPSKPVLYAPAADEVVEDSTVVFEVGDSIDPDGDALTYTIEVSDDVLFGTLLHTETVAADENNRAQFGPVEALSTGTYYYRAWANDGLVDGPGASARFYVELDDGPADGGIGGDFGIPPGGDGGIGEDTITGGGCACDVDGTDPATPVAVLLGLMVLGLRRRRR